MKVRYLTIVVLLIGAHLLTELHTFIYWLNPNSQYYYVDNWFLQSGFQIKKLNILWYLKMIEDSMLLGAIIFAGACQAYSRNYETYLQWQRYSFRLYLIWCIYFLYHFFDLIAFFFNYKTSYIAYIIALSLVSVCSTAIAFYKRQK